MKKSKLDQEAWLKKERKKMDQLTKKLVLQLRKRRLLSLKIQKMKTKLSLPKTDPKRELEILDEHTANLGTKEAAYIRSVLKQILKSTKS